MKYGGRFVMPLNIREVTEAMRNANRANAQKSTGPRTEQGKYNSRGNAFRHGLFGNKLCPWGEALDEKAADYQRFCRRYAEALQVRDDFEVLLAADMARTQWRLERLLHAEAAGLAWRRVKFENDHRRKEASEGVGLRAGFEHIASHEGGYGALPETEGKYELILFLLRTLVMEVQTDGYTEMGWQCLRVLYGPQPAWPNRFSSSTSTRPCSRVRRKHPSTSTSGSSFWGKCWRRSVTSRRSEIVCGRSAARCMTWSATACCWGRRR